MINLEFYWTITSCDINILLTESLGIFLIFKITQASTFHITRWGGTNFES